MEARIQGSEAAVTAWVVVHHRGVAPRLLTGLQVCSERRRVYLSAAAGPILSMAVSDAADFARCLLLGGISVEPQRVDMFKRLDMWDGLRPVPSYMAAFSMAGGALTIEMQQSSCYLADWDPLGAPRTIILPGGLAAADALARQLVEYADQDTAERLAAAEAADGVRRSLGAERAIA